jgi:hypothetical protein
LSDCLDQLLEDAREQVIAVSLPGFSGKQDAVRWYKKEYGDAPDKYGGLAWRQHLIQDLLPFTPQTGKNPAKNLGRRFDPSRVNTPELKNAKQYQALSKSIPVLKPPENGYHVHYDGGILFSECEERSFDVDITGDLAQEVAEHPGRVIDIAMRVYMQLEGEDESSVPGPCDDEGCPEILVTANEEDYEPPEVKKHKPAKPFFKPRR